MSSVVVVVDGDEYPVDLDAVTGEQVVLLRSLAVAPETLAIVVAQDGVGVGSLPEVVAFMALSLSQQGKPCDIGWLARNVSGSAMDDAMPNVEIRSEIDVD